MGRNGLEYPQTKVKFWSKMFLRIECLVCLVDKSDWDSDVVSTAENGGKPQTVSEEWLSVTGEDHWERETQQDSCTDCPGYQK